MGHMFAERERMVGLTKTSNKLGEKDLIANWDKKKDNVEKMDESELDDFPRLSESAKPQSHAIKQLLSDGQYDILIDKDASGIVRAKIPSRHIQAEIYPLDGK